MRKISLSATISLIFFLFFAVSSAECAWKKPDQGTDEQAKSTKKVSGYREVIKKKYVRVITVDGMDRNVSLFYPPGFQELKTVYVYEAFTKKDLQAFTRKDILFMPFTWTRNTARTKAAVQNLSRKIANHNKKDEPVILLTHSWGSVIAYLALTENPQLRVEKLITLGSPIYSSNMVVSKAVQEIIQIQGGWPLKKPDNLGSWRNYYADCDNLSGPIACLASEDNVRDSGNYGSNPACHSSYLNNNETMRSILLYIQQDI